MKKELLTFKDPKSPISEVFRSLRTNIQFMSSDKDLKTILITSTVSGEGKSLVTANLAITFAQTGKKVILVDADMRKGRQHQIFTTPQKPGLSNYLSNVMDEPKKTNLKGKAENDLENYVKSTDVENLWIIPAGNVPPNPSELLVNERMKKLIKKLKDTYDIVIFDGTPSLLVTDAIILSRMVDSTIIVTSYKETKMENLKKVKRDIQNVGGKIAGIILNKMPISMKKYENSYYYGKHEQGCFETDRKNKIEVQEVENGVSIAEPIIKKEDEVLEELKQYLDLNKENDEKIEEVEERIEEKVPEKKNEKKAKRGKRLKDD